MISRMHHFPGAGVCSICSGVRVAVSLATAGGVLKRTGMGSWVVPSASARYLA